VNEQRLVIVCGLGNLGLRVAELAARVGLSVSVVTKEAREDRLREARGLGAEVHLGDARDGALLRKAGIDRALALISTTHDDLLNIETGLDARRLRAELRLVLRIFDQNLAASLEETLGGARALGASMLAGPLLAFEALGAPVLGAVDFGENPLLIGRREVDASSALRGLTPEEAWNRCGVLLLESHADTSLAAGDSVTLLTTRASYASLCGLPKRKRASLTRLVRLGRRVLGIWTSSARGLRAVFLMLLALIAVSIFLFQRALDLKLVDAYYYVLTTVTTVGYGDISPRDASSFTKVYATFVMVLGSMTLAVLYAMVTDFVIRERVRATLGGPGPALSKHVVVVGLGNVGYRTVDELARLGIETTVVDRDPDRALLGADVEQGSLVAGDGRLPATLSAAHIEHATALVAATGDDAANLGAALTARRLAPRVRTVVRVFDGDFARKVEEGGLANVALSSSRAAAPAFVAAALFEGVLAAYTREGDLVALLESRVSQMEDGMLAGESAHAKGTRCIARLTATGSIEPLAPDARLRNGERLLCLARRPFVVRREPGSA